MTQAEFSESLGFKQSFWSLILAGKRHLRWNDARMVAGTLGGGIEVWMDTPLADPEKRLAAWKSYQQDMRPIKA
jgi:hypothetical protein